MLDFLWDLNQQRGIDEAKNSAAEAKSHANEHEQLLREMEFKLHRVSLACQAMWELVSERAHISQKELLAKIQEVDLRDGQLDGKITPRTVKCPDCGRTESSRNSRCIYCGSPLSKKHLFE